MLKSYCPSLLLRLFISMDGTFPFLSNDWAYGQIHHSPVPSLCVIQWPQFLMWIALSLKMRVELLCDMSLGMTLVVQPRKHLEFFRRPLVLSITERNGVTPSIAFRLIRAK
jgi:hypothetical protein